MKIKMKRNNLIKKLEMEMKIVKGYFDGEIELSDTVLTEELMAWGFKLGDKVKVTIEEIKP